ncbi:prepilin-type N-terminal cleavage/methylation domain-containing protein [Anoxybacillus tepidamans]|uniref:Prepilin-type N-terminal cleavage/methylation domain-containing protein n=1 Tax=Anoxybacteroides tepidamans TaxID=265948 RepID=A0A7W8MUJ7_9BACL|nr:prepilin-type N-terminal cleavage/methylation domain-containing protein [Anoxybacillus tepidamans]MBB5324582.1 prepilin-type N-terminal cleavage/methylation domain-containing protein [Anoxybacillus tepidamans]
MKTFVKRLAPNERGITLIELLATITISSIMLSVIYGVFMTGLNLYNKIGIEGQLRDDADYVVSRMMNKLYSFPFDQIEYCPNSPKGTCITLVNDKYVGIDQYNNLLDINPDKDYVDENGNKISTATKIELVETETGFYQFKIDDEILSTQANFKGSTITFQCSKEQNGNCVSAMINIDLTVQHPRTNKTLHLASKFGW